MDAQETRLLMEIGLQDIPLIFCSPSERRTIRRLVECGLVELRGRIFKKAAITARGFSMRCFD